MTVSELLETLEELERKGYGDCSLFVDSLGGLQTKESDEWVIASAVGFCKDFTVPKNAQPSANDLACSPGPGDP